MSRCCDGTVSATCYVMRCDARRDVRRGIHGADIDALVSRQQRTVRQRPSSRFSFITFPFLSRLSLHTRPPARALDDVSGAVSDGRCHRRWGWVAAFEARRRDHVHGPTQLNRSPLCSLQRTLGNRCGLDPDCQPPPPSTAEPPCCFDASLSPVCHSLSVTVLAPALMFTSCLCYSGRLSVTCFNHPPLPPFSAVCLLSALVARGSEVNVANKFGYSALQYAAADGQNERVKQHRQNERVKQHRQNERVKQQLTIACSARPTWAGPDSEAADAARSGREPQGQDSLAFRVQGSGFRVQGSGSRVQGSGFRVQGPGSRVQGSGFRGNGCAGQRCTRRYWTGRTGTGQLIACCCACAAVAVSRRKVLRV
eukprot:478777-Rhodomonas_salina.1